MITLNDDDAAFALDTVRAVLLGNSPDETDLRETVDLVAHGSAAVPADDTITDPCHCNHGDRDNHHQRGDRAFCLDAM